jgi:hypothetical protein
MLEGMDDIIHSIEANVRRHGRHKQDHLLQIIKNGQKGVYNNNWHDLV